MPQDCRPRSSDTHRARRERGPRRTDILLSQVGAPGGWQPVAVDEVRDDVVTVTVADSTGAADRVVRYRSHEPASLLAAVRSAGRSGWVDPRYRLLFLESWPDDPDAVFSLHPAGEPLPSSR